MNERRNALCQAEVSIGGGPLRQIRRVLEANWLVATERFEGLQDKGIVGNHILRRRRGAGFWDVSCREQANTSYS